MSTTHRRNIALPPAKSATATATAPAPTLPVASSTVDTISNHFAKLRTNHKLFTSSKGQNGYSKSHVETHSQAKPMVVSPIAEASNKSFAQSTLQHRRNTSEMNRGSSRTTGIGRVEKKLNESHEKNHLVKAISSSNTDGIKKVPMKESEFKKETHEDCDIKEEILSSKSDKLKNLHKNESRGGHDMKRASDFLSRSLDSGLRLKNFSEGCELKRPSFSLAEGGGRRRSFYRSQAEMSDFFSCNGVKIVAVDMPPFMQIHAVDCARKTHDSLEKFTSKALALNLKKEFDGGYGPAWHCIVGTSFGSFVTHSVGGFMYFSMDHKLYILLFKTTVQRAD